MNLALNIGNTNFALCFNKEYDRIIRTPIKTVKSKDDFVKVVKNNLESKQVKAAIISSVIPSLTVYLAEAVADLYNIRPVIVKPSVDMKLDLSCYDVSLIGNDRIAVCEAALCLYGLPAVVFDFGTATTVNIVDKNGRFLGGSIMAGLSMGLKALANDTAQLPDTGKPIQTKIIGSNTKECLLSGALYGNACMLDGMVRRIESELGGKATVLVTGGNAEYVIPLCKTQLIYDSHLLFKGLYSLLDERLK